MADSLPVMMLPGLMCDARIFAGLTAAFPNATAFPGYGLISDIVAMARKVLDRAPPRFALLGHSMGARVALEVVRVAPERVERLALISTGVHTTRPGEADKRHALREIGRREGMAALVRHWLPPMIGETNRGDQALHEYLGAMCELAGLAAFEAQIEALLNRPEVESFLPSIRCPTLVATGEEDIWSPPAQHESIAAAISGAELAIIERAGHMLPAEAPGALNPHIAGWLARPAYERPE